MNTTPRSTLARLVRRKRKAAPREAELAQMARALLEGGMQGEAIGWLQASVAAALNSTATARGGRTTSGGPRGARRPASPSEAAAAAPTEEGASVDTREGSGRNETIGRRWLRAATAMDTRPRLPDETVPRLRGEETGDKMAEDATHDGGATDSAARDARDAPAPGRHHARSPRPRRARLPELTVRRLLERRAGDGMAVGAIHYERPTHPAAAEAGAGAAPRVPRAAGSSAPVRHSRTERLGAAALGDDTETMRAIAASPAFRREIERIIEDTSHRARVAHGYGR